MNQQFNGNNNKIEKLLRKLSTDYFEILNLEANKKREIFSEIKQGLLAKKGVLKELIVEEVKLTERDAEKEIERAYKTFSLAEEKVDFSLSKEVIKNGKKILEKRLARGPLLVITPFSSPLSSPAHKISLGIIAGTSVLFKPSSKAEKIGKALFEIIHGATEGKYVYLWNYTEKELETIVADERIGIISFTGGYETGKKIIKTGGVKRYHMELTGGNSAVIFSPDYRTYNDQLISKLLDGILAKNGQRCVSIKHIFIPIQQKEFIDKIQSKLLSLKNMIKKDFYRGQRMILGPLISSDYAKNAEEKIYKILKTTKRYTPLIKFERKKDYLFPAMYSIENIKKDLIKNILEYDLPGPILFVYFYKNKEEYEKQILEALKNDYIRSGLQVSLYTEEKSDIKKFVQDLLWGGIIVNDIPTFRDEYMSFGGFGKAGLGKEGFFETLYYYTDPQVIVYTI